MRSNFDKQLAVLQNQLTEMATFIENSIDCAATALITGDLSKAEKAIEYHNEIDRMEHDIEALCLRILLLQQPAVSFHRTGEKIITPCRRQPAGDDTYLLLLNFL